MMVPVPRKVGTLQWNPQQAIPEIFHLPTGVAGYTITVQCGVYKIGGRVIIAPTATDDSFCVEIPGAKTQTVNHYSGWVRRN